MLLKWDSKPFGVTTIKTKCAADLQEQVVIGSSIVVFLLKYFYSITV